MKPANQKIEIDLILAQIRILRRQISKQGLTDADYFLHMAETEIAEHQSTATRLGQHAQDEAHYPYYAMPGAQKVRV